MHVQHNYNSLVGASSRGLLSVPYSRSLHYLSLFPSTLCPQDQALKPSEYRIHLAQCVAAGAGVAPGGSTAKADKKAKAAADKAAAKAAKKDKKTAAPAGAAAAAGRPIIEPAEH